MSPAKPIGQALHEMATEDLQKIERMINAYEGRIASEFVSGAVAELARERWLRDIRILVVMPVGTVVEVHYPAPMALLQRNPLHA